MRFKNTIIYGIIFVGLLAFVYLHEIKGGAERKEAEQRAKKMLVFDEEKVQQVTIAHTGGDTVVCARRSEEKWEIERPVPTDADAHAVERVINTIRDADIDRTVADSAMFAAGEATLDDFGLDPPEVTVHLQVEGDELDTLSFGDESPTGSYAFVKRAATQEVFTIPLWRKDNVNKKLFDLRDRRVLGFERTEVRTIELERKDGRIVLSRAEDDYYSADWVMEEPIETKADRDAVRGLLNDLENGKVEEFVDEAPEDLNEYGLDEPAIDVTLWVGKDRAKKRLTIGDPKDDRYYARDEARPSVFLVDSSFVGRLTKDAFDLRDRKVAEFEKEDVDRIELVYPDSSIVCVKDTAANWSLAAPQERKGKNWKIQGILTDIANLKAEEFVAEKAPKLSKYGLEGPRIIARLWKGEEVLVELWIGDGKDEQVYARTRDGDTVYLVKDDIVEDLSPQLEDLAEEESAGGA